MPDTNEKARILICEYEVLIAADLASRLKILGHEVCGQAARGEEALELVEQLQPDLVMMDIVLQGELDGIDAAEIIREKWRVPVVFLIADSDFERLDQTKSSTPFLYICKPFRNWDLKNTTGMALYFGHLEAEKRKIEESLSDTRSQLELIINSTPGPLAFINANEKYLFTNIAYRNLYNASSASIVGKNIEEILPATTYQNAKNKISRVLTGEAVRYKNMILTDQGQEIVLSLQYTPYFDGQGNVTAFLDTAEDITEQTHYEETVCESDRYYTEFINKIQAAIVVHGPDTRIISSNSKAQEILGLTEDQMLGRAAMESEWKFFNAAGKSLNPSEYPVNKVLATKQPLRDMIGGIYRPQTDDLVWVLVTADPVFDKENNIQLVIVTFMDITENQLTEKALRESESFLSATGMLAKVGGWELDASTLELKWTEQTYRIHELPLEHKPDFKEGIEFFHPDDIETLMTAFQRALKQGEPFDLELRFITAKGNNLWVRGICNPQVVDGKVIGLRGAFQDTTELRQAEEALRKSERMLSTIMANTKDGIIRTDRNFRHVFVNDTLCAETGFSSDQIVGKTDKEIGFPGDLSSLWRTKYEKVFLTGKSEIFEFMFVKPNKGERIFHAVATPEFNEDNEVETILSSIRDITELKHTEKALRESENRYRSMIDFSPLGIGIVNTGGVIVTANQSLASILGYGVEELIGMNGGDLTHPEDLIKERKFFKPLLRGEIRSYNLEKRYRHKDGGYFWYNVTVANLLGSYSDDAFLLGFIEDINNRKHLEQERENLINDLQNALAEIKELRGFLPICANCKKIRDDKGYWQQVEQYIQDRTDARFSHSICPDCMKKLYPDIADEILNRSNNDE